MFDQTIAVVEPKVYKNLYDEYIYHVSQFRQLYPGIIFDVLQSRIKNK
jgi:hypothetical protein